MGTGRTRWCVLADHAADIVMFVVPPPKNGVRGIDEYRATWPSSFEWQRAGAKFEIVELDVTAGVDVAFAHALLRCGSRRELEGDPDTDCDSLLVYARIVIGGSSPLSTTRFRRCESPRATHTSCGGGSAGTSSMSRGDANVHEPGSSGRGRVPMRAVRSASLL